MVSQTSQTIPVLAEHRDFFVINKPAGISVHQQEHTDGLITCLKRQLATEQLWLVHRLDQITSGCLVIARNKATARALGEQFQKREVTKFYLALCDKRPKKRQGLVKGDMKKIRSGKWALSRTSENPAVTQFYDMGLGNGLRLQVLKPYTGQTHQLRVALNSLGSTILGDQFYGGTSSDRTYLHAWQLSFLLNAERLQFSCLPGTGEHFLSQQFIDKTQELSPIEKQFRWPEIKFNNIENANAGEAHGGKAP